MGKKMMVWSLLGLGIMMMVLLANSISFTNAARTPNDLTCQDAITKLLPCGPFLKGSPSPSSSCCSNVQEVVQQANTTQCRRDLCACFQKALTDYHLDPNKAEQIPKLCNIKEAIPLDPKVKCSTVSF